MSEPINRDAMTEYIKVNLPLTEQDYANGNGEGVWVLVDTIQIGRASCRERV